MHLGKYKKQELAIRNQLGHVKNVSYKMKMVNSEKQINEVIERMDADLFRLVMVGEFSRGKSTFVNALLGRKILPASKNPTTAIISKIVYGDSAAFEIYYKDGKGSKGMDETEFKKITAPQEPDESDEMSVKEFVQAQMAIADIDYAKITYPLSFCKDRVEVVDTPGTNDLNVGRMEITYGYLNQADAVVLLLAAYQPLTASEKQFIKERILGNQIEDIFFVISHKDDLDNAEQEQDVIDFIAKNLKDILPENFNFHNRIFLVNSLGALYSHMQDNGEELTPKQMMRIPDDFVDTGFPEFEDKLGDFLANDKGMARLRKYNRDTQAIIHTMQHDLDVNIGVVSHSADEIRRQAANLAPKFKQAKRKAEGIISDMRMSITSNMSDIEYKCHSAGKNILSKAKAAVENLTSDMSQSAMQQAIEREVTAEKKHFMDELIKEWQNTLQKENDKAQRKLQTIWQDINVEYQHSFNLPAVVDNNDMQLTLSSGAGNYHNPLERSFSDKSYEIAGVFFKEAGKADNLFGVIGGIGIGTIAGTLGVAADLFNSFFGGNSQSSVREDWRDKVRSQVVRTYSGLGDKMAKTVTPIYKSSADEYCRNLQKNVNRRLEDMERQLQDIIREKEAQEKNAEQQKVFLMGKKKELNAISQELNKLVG